MRHILQISHIAIFSYSRDWNEQLTGQGYAAIQAIQTA